MKIELTEEQALNLLRGRRWIMTDVVENGNGAAAPDDVPEQRPVRARRASRPAPEPDETTTTGAVTALIGRHSLEVLQEHTKEWTSGSPTQKAARRVVETAEPKQANRALLRGTKAQLKLLAKILEEQENDASSSFEKKRLARAVEALVA